MAEPSIPPPESPAKPGAAKFSDGKATAAPRQDAPIRYADGGLTKPDNLITVCTRFHKHIHQGHLGIDHHAPRGARFLNRFGQDIRHERTLDVAFWLDIWCGWRDEQKDRRYLHAPFAPLDITKGIASGSGSR